MENPQAVVDIEIVEDLTSQSRLDEGYLRLKRLKVRNRRADGTASHEFTVDTIDRPTLDAVVVLVYRHTPQGIEILVRAGLRPAAHFRGRVKQGADSLLHVPELVAGVLEPADSGEAGVRYRATQEVKEEAGFEVAPDDVRVMGAPQYPSPGVLSEKIYFTAVDVTGKPQQTPQGDGSPLEEDARLAWWKVGPLLEACRDGRVPDTKSELALTRFLAGVGKPRPAAH